MAPIGCPGRFRKQDLVFWRMRPLFGSFSRKHLGTKTRDILVDRLRLLNFFDIHPLLIPGERCCGHDLLWSGDKENFLKLAKLNAEMLNDSGVEEIVTACPECYRTLHRDYEGFGIHLNARVTHIFMSSWKRRSTKARLVSGRWRTGLPFKTPAG